MPIYEYKCQDCDHEFECEVKFRERYDPVPCPKCGSADVEKLISLCDFTLKGSGWANMGYDKSGSKKGSKK
jgi:putative FmdB family regulatory protein